MTLEPCATHPGMTFHVDISIGLFKIATNATATKSKEDIESQFDGNTLDG